MRQPLINVCDRYSSMLATKSHKLRRLFLLIDLFKNLASLSYLIRQPLGKKTITEDKIAKIHIKKNFNRLVHLARDYLNFVYALAIYARLTF